MDRGDARRSGRLRCRRASHRSSRAPRSARARLPSSDRTSSSRSCYGTCARWAPARSGSVRSSSTSRSPRTGCGRPFATPGTGRSSRRLPAISSPEMAPTAVRRILGIEMRGPGRVADAITAIFHAPLWDVVGNRRYAIYPVSHPDPRGVFVAVSRKDRWVFGLTRDPGQLDPAESRRLRPRMEARLGATRLGRRTRWTSTPDEAERRPAVEHRRRSLIDDPQRLAARRCRRTARGSCGGRLARSLWCARGRRADLEPWTSSEAELDADSPVPAAPDSEPLVDPAYGTGPRCPSANCRPSQREGWGSPQAARCCVRPDGMPAALGVTHLVRA